MNARLTLIGNWEALAKEARYRCGSIAVNCGTSERQLRRHFLTVFGETTQAWLDQRRAIEALILLAQALSIKEVSFALGYKQVSHFCRLFKKAHGITPSMYVGLLFKCQSSLLTQVGFGWALEEVGETYVPLPIRSRCAIHFNVIIDSRLNRPATAIFFGSPLRRSCSSAGPLIKSRR